LRELRSADGGQCAQPGKGRCRPDPLEDAHELAEHGRVGLVLVDRRSLPRRDQAGGPLLGGQRILGAHHHADGELGQLGQLAVDRISASRAALRLARASWWLAASLLGHTMTLGVSRPRACSRRESA
jgi:hypothetical protein